MELKIKYHYSYFIYPYVVKEEKYNKYMQKLLKNSKCTLKIFEKRKNANLYSYFLPTVKEYMFKSFGFADSNTRIFNSLGVKLKANMLSQTPCTIFEYDMGQDVQAKAGEEDGIFFKIEKIEIICFNTGICFLLFKTNIEGTDRFSDLLNFNFKFRDINSEVNEGLSFSKIKIQTGTFNDIKRLSELIRELTGSAVETKKIDIDTNRFLIYSYVCIDQEYWDDVNGFSGIEKEFFKYANVLNSEFNSSFNNDRLKTVNLGNYIKVGISNAGINLIASSINTVNYTNLPFEFENEYLYTYIFALYKKYYLTKLLKEFKNIKKATEIKEKFVNFTNDIWIHEITNNDNGILIYKEIAEVLDLEDIYEKAKRQYDIAYKDFRVRDNEKVNKVILFLLIISLIINVVNFIVLFRLK